MNFFLGVDGGQSSTTALVGDERGRVVGSGRGGPCNHVGAAEGRGKFLRVIGDCIRQASAEAGMPGLRFASAVLGFSGGPADKEALVRELISADRLLVSHDALVGLVGACGGEPGLIAIAGTGSIAFGRNARGVTARSGGWGYIFGDEGGGFDIVRQALRAALRMEEGWGPPTALREALLEETGAASADDLLHRFYTVDWPRSRVATLSRIVDRVAGEGDGVAAGIVERAAGDLAEIANAVRARLFGPGERCLVSYVGGVFRSRMLCARFQTLVEAGADVVCEPPRFGPAAGGLIEAYRLAGVRVELSGLREEK